MKGKYPNISNKEYHQGPGLSSSGLKKLCISGAHYKAFIEQAQDSSREMVVGSLVHTMILEPYKVDKEYFVGEFNVRRGKDFEAAVKEAGDRTLVSKEEHETATAIVESFLVEATDHPLFNAKEARLLEGEKEHSYYWEDPATGVLCKCRPDNVTPDGMIVDLKTTRNALLDSFQKTVVDFGYHISAAFYMRGIEAVTGQKPKGFTIIALETAAPFGIQVFQFDEVALRIGAEEVEKALQVYSECVSTETWPAYPKKLVELSVPNWYSYKRNKS